MSSCGPLMVQVQPFSPMPSSSVVAARLPSPVRVMSFSDQMEARLHLKVFLPVKTIFRPGTFSLPRMRLTPLTTTSTLSNVTVFVAAS